MSDLRNSPKATFGNERYVILFWLGFHDTFGCFCLMFFWNIFRGTVVHKGEVVLEGHEVADLVVGVVDGVEVVMRRCLLRISMLIWTSTMQMPCRHNRIYSILFICINMRLNAICNLTYCSKGSKILVQGTCFVQLTTVSLWMKKTSVIDLWRSVTLRKCSGNGMLLLSYTEGQIGWSEAIEEARCARFESGVSLEGLLWWMYVLLPFLLYVELFCPLLKLEKDWHREWSKHFITHFPHIAWSQWLVSCFRCVPSGTVMCNIRCSWFPRNTLGFSVSFLWPTLANFAWCPWYSMIFSSMRILRQQVYCINNHLIISLVLMLFNVGFINLNLYDKYLYKLF